jgi:hypothetical protein
VTVSELIVLLQAQDGKKRVVAADRDGAGPAADIEFIDQRVDNKGEPLITIWVHR